MGIPMKKYGKYLSDMEPAYTKAYNEFALEYYDINENSPKDELGMYIVNDTTPLKKDNYEDLQNQVHTNYAGLQSENQDEYTEPPNPQPENGGKSLILGFLDYAMGILLYIPKIIILIIPLLIQGIFSLVVSGGQGEWAWVSIEQILFNRLTITNINFFSQITAGGQEITTPIINDIRGYVSNWYYAFRNLVIILYLCILIYIGIRMALSSIPEDKAKYKAMLTNWFVGLGIVFVLQYIIVIVINANELLISTIDPKGIDGSSLMQDLFGQIFWLSFTTSFGSLIIYSILLILAFMFFIIYLKRMITIAFLIIIAPLITLTYPIDKAADNKSQILNSWLGEFVSDVLIQFFHCVIYIILVQTSMNTLASTEGSLNFGAMTVAIVCTCSIFYAETILKKLFGLNRGGSTFLQNVAMGAVLQKVISNAKVIKGSKNDKQNVDVPDTMPNGENTKQAALDLKDDNLNNKLEHQFGEEKGEGENTNNDSGKKNTKPNIITKGIKTYFKEVDILAKNVIPGYGAIRKRHKTKYNMKTKDIQKLFGEALKRYSPPEENITKEQFLLRMQALKNTDIKKINNEDDLVMKTWMMALEQSYTNDGKINPEMLLDKTINKYANTNFEG